MRHRFCQAGIPAYPSLPLAAQALAHLATYFEKKDALTPGLPTISSQKKK
jgi:acyl-CoA synthetase (NDP forming)